MEEFVERFLFALAVSEERQNERRYAAVEEGRDEHRGIVSGQKYDVEDGEDDDECREKQGRQRARVHLLKEVFLLLGLGALDFCPAVGAFDAVVGDLFSAMTAKRMSSPFFLLVYHGEGALSRPFYKFPFKFVRFILLLICLTFYAIWYNI